MKEKFLIRRATISDMKAIVDMIMELAVYEKLEHEVMADEALLSEWSFDKKVSHPLIIEEDGISIGYVIYFYNFSTFLTKAGIYIEDIYIKPEYRGRGYGKEVFKYIAKIAKEENLGRIDWACLDWNEPSLKFYRSMGANSLDEWITLRLEGDGISKLSEM